MIINKTCLHIICLTYLMLENSCCIGATGEYICWDIFSVLWVHLSACFTINFIASFSVFSAPRSPLFNTSGGDCDGVEICWMEPAVSPECCTRYNLELRPMENRFGVLSFNSTTTCISVSKDDYCQDVDYEVRVACERNAITGNQSEARLLRNGMWYNVQ